MSEEAPKLRLRPKLNVDSAAPGEPAQPASVDLARPPAPAAEPSTTSTTPPIVRAKPRLPGVATTPPMPPRPHSAPSFAVVVPPTPPLASSSSTPPLAPTTEPPRELNAAAGPSLAERTQRLHRAALFIAAAGVIVFAAIGYVAFPKLIAQQVEHDQAARRLEKFLQAERAADHAKGPQPPTPSGHEKDPTRPHATAPSPAAPPASTKPQNAPEPATASARALEPSTNFQAWVQNVRITGLRSGATPRILIGGASFDVGETVHPELGIVFDGYDADRRVLRFKDPTGALAERRHP